MHISRVVALALVAACGGSPQKPVTKVAPPPPPISKPAPPPPTPLTIEERVTVHAGCFADFVAEVPEFFTRCYSAASQTELVDSGEPPAVGTPAIAASTRALWDAFALKGEVRMNLASGENVLTIALVSGTQQATFQNIPSSGKTFAVFIAEAQSLDDQGRHGAVRNYVDLASMTAQLGAAPRGTKFRAPYPATGNPALTVIATGSEGETANVATIEAGFGLFNQQDWKGLTALYDGNAAIYDQTAPADTEGSKAIGKYFADLGKAFSGGQAKVETVWGAGDFVVAEVTFTGTNDGPAPHLGVKKATNKPVTLRRAHVFRLDGGKVLQHWIFGNGLAAPVQLGLITPPA